MFCYRCRTWGKHFAKECRRPQASINALAEDDANVMPSTAYDNFYDGLSTMPPPIKEAEN
jgi:hypothetical protein